MTGFWVRGAALLLIVGASGGFGMSAARGEEPAAAPVRQGPKRLAPGDHGVGRYVPDVTFDDLQGGRRRLSELAGGKALVVAMTSTSCPISKKYLPTLVAIAKERAPQGVKFLLVNPVATDEVEAMKIARQAFGDAATYAFDPDNKLARAVGAASTADVVVLDPSRTVVYHGAVDDQYGFGYSIDEPRRRFLQEALDAILAGKTPAVAATEAPGCVLDVESAPTRPAIPTYHARVSRIVQAKCVECHREGGVAPFRLDRYEDVVAHAPMIKQVVERGVMPPWFAASTNKESASPWANDRSLADAEKKDLLAWLAGGRPAGDAADAPRPREFADGWLIGKPDAIYAFAKPTPVKATGTMPYQNVIVETNLEEDRWVQAIEVRPGDPSVVHHVLVFVSTKHDPTERRDDAADERSGYWGIYVPGNSTLVYPEGMAKRIPKGAVLRFQMHYTPNGKATEDTTRIGLVFAKSPPKHEVKVAGIVNLRLSIPPNAENHEEVATLRVPLDVQVLAFLPHMHLRGKAARYELTSGDGRRTTLLDVPRYDFNWQLLYRFAEPFPVRGGDTLKFTAWYDNSANNPANPDPTRTVRWGPQTFDEMHLGYVEYIVPGVAPGESVERSMPGTVAALRAEAAAGGGALFAVIDRDRDGKLTWDEVRQAGENAPRWKDRMDRLREIYKRLDADGDEKLDKTEFSKIRELGGGN